MLVAGGILQPQAAELGDLLRDDLVAVISRVRPADEHREGEITHAEGVHAVGMPGHHRGGGEAVGHARSELPDPVATGGITEQIDLVRVHAADREEILDQPVEQPVDVRLVPEIPSIGRGARRDHDALGRGVEPDLVAPLLVVDLGRGAATAVHRDPEAPLALGGEVELPLQPAEGLVPVLDLAGGHLGGALGLQLRPAACFGHLQRRERRYRGDRATEADQRGEQQEEGTGAPDHGLDLAAGLAEASHLLRSTGLPRLLLKEAWPAPPSLSCCRSCS